CNSRYFSNVPFILFLNKFDVFQTKITRKNISNCFAEYRGPQSATAAGTYIRDRFLELNRSETREVYPHFTNATDSKNIARVFESVKDIILKHNLRRAGFM
ncbi:guanine nucleotide binding protein (G-protein), alpha subunit, partial [Kipferlia bialata]